MEMNHSEKAELELPLVAEEQCLRVKHNFKLSKSTLSKLEDTEVCPVKWKSQWLERRWGFEPGLAMLKGMYFEYLAIGGGVGDEDITDLPRLKNGSKTADQIRIETQADIFNKALYDAKCEYHLGFDVVDTQVRVEDETAKGVIDIVANIGDELAIIDLKLTRDFFSVAAPYGYGYMDSMDMLQMALYKHLYDKEHGTDVKVYILVGDFSTQTRRKLVEVDISQRMIDEVIERVATGYEVIEQYQEHGWSYDPSERECKDCPLECANRYEEAIFNTELIHV